MKRKQHKKLAKNTFWSSRELKKLPLVLLAVIILVWIYFALTNVRNFPIKTVRVKGDYRHISTIVLQDTIKPFVKVSFFALPANALQNRLQQLPWVASANIRRIFPSTLIITLQEKQPVAIWNNNALLTDKGILFFPEKSTYPKDLPYLNGPDDEEKSLLSAMQQVDKIFQSLNLKVQQLTLSPRQSWQLVLSDGIKVNIGQRDINLRLQQLVAVYPKIIGDHGNKVVSIDLRYPNGIAIQWKRGLR